MDREARFLEEVVMPLALRKAGLVSVRVDRPSELVDAVVRAANRLSDLPRAEIAVVARFFTFRELLLPRLYRLVRSDHGAAVLYASAGRLVWQRGERAVVSVTWFSGDAGLARGFCVDALVWAHGTPASETAQELWARLSLLGEPHA